MPGAFKRVLLFASGASVMADRVFVTIQWDGRKLSITGEVNPNRNGDAWVCGQICDERLIPTRLREIWKRWHLNDMRAGCEHQRAEGWDKKPIDPKKPLETYGKFFEGQTQPSWNMLAWIPRSEHPEGLLSHPCPVCGYKYGSAWVFERVPFEIIEELEAMGPDAREKPK